MNKDDEESYLEYCSQAMFRIHILELRLNRYDFNLTIPNDKILEWPKPKAFADNKMDLSQKLKFNLGRVQNIVGKGDAGYQHFLLFLQYFQKVSVSRSLELGIVW